MHRGVQFIREKFRWRHDDVAQEEKKALLKTTERNQRLNSVHFPCCSMKAGLKLKLDCALVLEFSPDRHRPPAHSVFSTETSFSAVRAVCSIC